MNGAWMLAARMERNFGMGELTILLIIIAIIALIYIAVGPKIRGSGGSSSKAYHRSKLVSVLLNLDDRAVDELLRLYKDEFGPGPARYARKTYRKWKTGEVRPAKQTFERFLVRLPHVMSYDLKCEVLRHFMEEYSEKATYELEVYTDDWEEKLDPLVRQIIDKAFSAQLPAPLERKLRWLGEGDMQAAQGILRASQAEEGRIIVSMLHREFENIEKLLSAEHLKPKVSHVLKFPYGTIELEIKRR